MKLPTPRQLEILRYIKNFSREFEFSPTIREIAGNFSIAVRCAYDHVKALEKKNLIVRKENCSRSIRIVEETPDETDEVSIPILGYVAAGEPLFAEENNEGYLKLPVSVVGNGRHFALRVEGDSMINANIMDGDIAVFVRQPTAENGQIVVAVMDDYAVTLKRFYKEHNRIRLQPENPAYRPLYAVYIKILGRLVATVHTYKQ